MTNPWRNLSLVCWLIPLGLLGGDLDLELATPPSVSDQLEERLFGNFYSKFRLTLDNGHRSEILGPLYYQEDRGVKRTWAVPPLFSYVQSEEPDYVEFDILYPLLTHDRFGGEYRFQIAQWFNFSGGLSMANTNVDRFTLFPVYFQQRSGEPDRNYTAVFPIYGRFQNRFFRDKTYFVMWPLYVRTWRKDMITDNYLFPLFHLRRGESLRGWQFWPLFGREVKLPTQRTNNWNDLEVVGGHRKTFVLWPIYFNHQIALGTTNPVSTLMVLPFYYRQRSPALDSTGFPWPIGYVYTDDRENQFRQWGAPWPIIVFARGEGKTMNRVFPLFSRGRTPEVERNSYLWPLVHYTRVRAEQLDRARTRSLFFVYSFVRERNLDAETMLRRRDVWPLFTWLEDHEGRRRFQVLSVLEPILPNRKSIQRNYSHVWSLWRSESHLKTGATSQSLLWNLYQRKSEGQTKKYSLLFGLFQYESNAAGNRGRVFYIPLGRKQPTEDQPDAVP